MSIKKEPLSSNDERDSDVERKRLAKNAREAERRRQQRLEKARAVTTSTFKGSSVGRVKAEEPSTPQRQGSINMIPHSSGRQSPIPPGEHTRQPWATGYKFTIEEDQFLCDYAQILVERDHTISASAIADKVHAKVGAILRRLYYVLTSLEVAASFIKFMEGSYRESNPGQT